MWMWLASNDEYWLVLCVLVKDIIEGSLCGCWWSGAKQCRQKWDAEAAEYGWALCCTTRTTRHTVYQSTMNARDIMFFKKKTPESRYDMVKLKITFTINTVLYVELCGSYILAQGSYKDFGILSVSSITIYKTIPNMIQAWSVTSVVLFDCDEATKTIWLRLWEDCGHS